MGTTVKKFGSARQYYNALRHIEAKIPASHRDLLRAHFAAPDHTVSWRELARSVGYPNAEAVKLQYGKFAHRVADRLGVTKGEAHGFWLHILADWAPHRDPMGHTMFRLRPQLVAALRQIGWAKGAPPPSVLETDDGMLEGRPELRLVAHRHREGALRRRKIVEALRHAPDGKLRCAIPGCGFCFQDVYGDAATDYIQVHHIEPLGRRRRQSSTRLKDLIPVCANCHAMIHYLTPSRPLARLLRRPRCEARR